MRREETRQTIRPFTDLEYALIVLYGLQRMIRRTDYYQSFIPPREITRGSADGGEVYDALQATIELVRDRITGEVEEMEEMRMREARRGYNDQPAD